MSSLNRVYILGTLGSRPILQSTKNGKSFCRMSLATDNHFHNGEEEKKTTDWHTVHVFGRQAEAATQYLDKGRQVLVEGKIFSQALGDTENKIWRSWINADRVTFMGGTKKQYMEHELSSEEENIN